MANKNVGPTKKVKSRILESIHEDAKGLFEAGAFDKTTMREFDALCLPKVPDYTAKQIKSIRLRCNASQTVFAAYMNISPSSLQKWEIGAKKPTGVALKLLSIIDDKGLDALI
jgi:putative transcriptional regulator